MSEENYFTAILAQIETTFPTLTPGAVRHAANKIGRRVKKSKQRDYALHLSHTPPETTTDCYDVFSVEASRVTVYVRMTTETA